MEAIKSEDAREGMTEVINTIKRGDGRSSLQTSGSYDPTHNLETLIDKPRQLELILDLLHYKEQRISHDHKKFFLFREGTTSYVYLAEIKAI